MKKIISLLILVLFFSIKGFAQFYSEPDVLLFLVTKSPFTNKSTGISLKFTDMAAQLSSGSNKYFQPQIRILSNTLASVSYQSLVTQGYSVSFYVNAKTLSIIDRKDNSVYNSGTPQGFDEMMKEMDAKAKQDKLIDEQWAKKISADMKRISTYINNPQSRKNVPEQFEKVKHDWLISDKDFFSESEKALYTKLDKVSEEILQENLYKTGDKYGVESNMSLISFMNSKETKMELPSECKLYQSGNSGFYLAPVRMDGYVKNGLLYTSDGLVVGKINQDESRFYIDFKDPRGENLRINIYKDWDYARFNFAAEEVNYITVCDSSKIPYDCKSEGISIVIKKDAPQGASLVAALQLFNLINPKQTSNSNINNTPLNQETVNEKVANAKGNSENIEGLKSNNKSENNDIYMVVEEMPEFPGGIIALRQYLANAIKYPENAMKNAIQGKVYVNFIINKDGSVSDAKVARSVDPSLDAEALRVVLSLPNWKPGKQNGVKVKVSYTSPVNFILKQ